MHKKENYNIIPVKYNVFKDIKIATDFISSILEIDKEINFNIKKSAFIIRTELLLNKVGDIDLLKGLIFTERLFNTILYMDMFKVDNKKSFNNFLINNIFNNGVFSKTLLNLSLDILKYDESRNENELGHSLINSFNNMKYNKDTIKIIGNNIFILVSDDIFNNISYIIETSYSKQILFKETYMELFKVYLNTLTFNKEIVSNNNYSNIIFNLNNFYLKNK